MKRPWKDGSHVLLTSVAAHLASWLMASTAVAHSPNRPEDAESLSKSVASAQAVVHAVVNNVQYRMSTKQTDQDESLPHTFVTYKIRETIRGSVKEGTL